MLLVLFVYSIPAESTFANGTSQERLIIILFLSLSLDLPLDVANYLVFDAASDTFDFNSALKWMASPVMLVTQYILLLVSGLCQGKVLLCVAVL